VDELYNCKSIRVLRWCSTFSDFDWRNDGNSECKSNDKNV